jgi:hypothetical protein
MRFTQIMKIKCADQAKLVALARAWDENQAQMDVMGFIGSRLLAERNNPGNMLLVAEFAPVDGTRTAAEEAALNNSREETERWAAALLEVIEGEPEFIDYDEIYRTGITGNLRTG